mmetsp:Transcript_6405/g.9245  ORF Transcript_6405/g.9245 Transcript_6405/m.9245 type:complete len:232 (-) Transcript_6405:839-1534(-)
MHVNYLALFVLMVATVILSSLLNHEEVHAPVQKVTKEFIVNLKSGVSPTVISIAKMGVLAPWVLSILLSSMIWPISTTTHTILCTAPAPEDTVDRFVRTKRTIVGVIIATTEEYVLAVRQRMGLSDIIVTAPRRTKMIAYMLVVSVNFNRPPFVQKLQIKMDSYSVSTEEPVKTTRKFYQKVLIQHSLTLNLSIISVSMDANVPMVSLATAVNSKHSPYFRLLLQQNPPKM